MDVQIGNVELLPEFEYVALRDYIQQLGVVDYSSESRIRDVAVRSSQLATGLECGRPLFILEVWLCERPLVSPRSFSPVCLLVSPS